MISMLIFQKILIGNLISDKENMFAVIMSEFKEEKPVFEASFNQYNDYQNTLKNDNEKVNNVSNFINVFLNSMLNIPVISKKRINILL